MKLQEYIDGLQDIINENPEHANLEVIYAIDDEGNGFKKIGFAPSLGNLDSEKNFNEVDSFEDLDESDRVINSVCVN